jgi:formylglycine-generating enzyme required for sulfatase activity
MFELFGAVASVLAVAAPVVKNLADIAQGGRKLYGFAADILDRFRKQVPPDQQQVKIREALTQAAALPQAEFDKKVEEIVSLELANESPEDRKAATEYLKLWPARIRAAFNIPQGSTDTTVPDDFTAHRPEDLLGIIPPRPPRFQVGDTPPGDPNWTLVERIGIGGFGEVWKAQGRRMTKTFRAFKFCLDPVAQGTLELEMENIELVQNELGDHPHIVKLLQVHFDGDTPWLQYEYVEGGELGTLIANWPNDVAARAASGVQTLTTLADTLEFCHNRITLDGRPRALIHRDMKPANVLFNKNLTLKITDFGISHTQARQALDQARLATVASRTMTTATSGFVRAGTPMYASDQQLNGDKPHPADDVHALGVMLYQMVLGDPTRPLNRDWYHVLERKHVCPQLIELIARSIASDQQDRFQHAGELADALKSLPKKLVAEPVTISQADLDKQLFAEIDAKVADAKEKIERAKQQLDRREWATAASTLEAIFHPTLRPADLYDRATAFRDGKKFVNALGMEFALVPKGTFWMGGGDGKCGDKQVTIDHDFYIGVYPVTQGEWQAVMGSNPSWFRKGGGGAGKIAGVSDSDLKRFPVEMVSWHDCKTFLQKLNEKTRDSGGTYRLPTEAEWEYACRGAATTQEGCSWNFYFQTPTNTLTPHLANFRGSGLERTTKVGSYKPNPLGLFDMHGNVAEWCECYGGSDRKCRGGSSYDDVGMLQAAYCTYTGPNNTGSGTGLRLRFSLD